jgi:hypothetical protein
MLHSDVYCQIDYFIIALFSPFHLVADASHAMLSDHFIELIIDFLDISPLIASIFRRCRH